GPPCVGDTECKSLVGPAGACSEKATMWCANSPEVACTTTDDCPACPTVNGKATPCRRFCQARTLKYYTFGTNADMTDLFLDPDEFEAHGGANTDASIARTMGDENGPYGSLLRSLACCVDAWWDPGGGRGTLCGTGDACPADLTCNE